MYQNDPMKVLTGECRLSYCNLTTPRAAQQGGEPKYSVTLLIPKTDVATKADIDAAIQAAANEALSKVWNGARPPQLRVPIYDGDGSGGARLRCHSGGPCRSGLSAPRSRPCRRHAALEHRQRCQPHHRPAHVIGGPHNENEV